MKMKIIQAAIAASVAGIVIYLVRKKIAENNKRNAETKKENEFISMQRRKFSDTYGEYTL